VVIELAYTKHTKVLHETPETDVQVGLPDDFEEHSVISTPGIDPIHCTVVAGRSRTNSTVSKTSAK
jgi:hypothetical protein